MRTALSRDARIFIQVADCAQAKDVPPALPSMLGRIVDHMATLAERREIAGHAVAWIVIEMRTSQHDISRSYRRQNEAALERDPLATAGAPTHGIGIPPATIAKMGDPTHMRPRAVLAARAGPIEPDHVRQLAPVDRVKPAVFRADRHLDSMSQPMAERKQNLLGLFLVCCVTVPRGAYRQFSWRLPAIVRGDTGNSLEIAL